MSKLDVGDIVLPDVKNTGIQNPALYNSTAVGGRKKKRNKSKKRRGGKKSKMNKSKKKR
jgi:hypothetical protein